MSVARNQARIARDLWGRLQPLDRSTPSRLHGLLADRRFGSRDRRFYREILLTAIRHARALRDLDEDAWAGLLAQTCAATKETIAFREEYTPSADSASALALPSPLDLMPEWFASEVDAGQSAANTASALLARAPVWVRLQTDTPDDVFAEWAALGWVATPHPALPDAWRLPPETAVTSCLTYQAGHYEVQDIGSQLILASLGLDPATGLVRWLDACAGAGGKSLQLARLLGPAALVEATDIRPAALVELRARATRARLTGIRTVARAEGRYDGVLVDAPCSGSGTWRRAPHLMACTPLSELAEAARLQGRLLADAARFVRPGGLLVYATCSIARCENRAVATAFLSAHNETFEHVAPAFDFGFAPLAPDPAPACGLALAPGVHDNDGFYVAAFRRAKDSTAAPL